VKVLQKRRDLLFPVPVGVIQYEGHDELNKKILEGIDAVDWNDYHAKKRVRYDVDDTKAEDPLSTRNLCLRANRSFRRLTRIATNTRRI
jgi:hypothetical protein